MDPVTMILPFVNALQDQKVPTKRAPLGKQINLDQLNPSTPNPNPFMAPKRSSRRAKASNPEPAIQTKASKKAVARKGRKIAKRAARGKAGGKVKKNQSESPEASPKAKVAMKTSTDITEESVEEDQISSGEGQELKLILKSPKSQQRTSPKVRRARTGPKFSKDVRQKINQLKGDPRFQKLSDKSLAIVIEGAEENDSPAFIATTSIAKNIRRRARVPWESWEEANLRKGVAIHGQHWNLILNDPNLEFKDRTQVDLKDKWRNMVKYREYSSVPFRRYMLVDHDHAPWTQNSKNPHIFKNRWPLEAAIKVATKDFIYENGAETVEIGLRDVSAENGSGTAEVHVFEVSRRREVAVDIPKFKGFRNAWVGQAKKLRTERFLTRDAVLSVLGSPTKS